VYTDGHLIALFALVGAFAGIVSPVRSEFVGLEICKSLHYNATQGVKSVWNVN
jgi:hypothetical protein